MYHRYLLRGWLLLAIFMFIISASNGCKKAVEVGSPASLTVRSEVFSNDETAFSAIRTMYAGLMSRDDGLSGGRSSISLLAALSSDEIQLPANSILALYTGFYKNAIQAREVPFWSELYKYIYTCNAAIEGIHASTGMSADAKEQLLGEAQFMRAFLYFYAVNLFGDVPLALTTDYRVNNSLSRSPKSQVYAQIILDLIDAQNKLNTDYLLSLTVSLFERLVPNKHAASALLARVYLYNQDWRNAIICASRVIDAPAYKMEPDPVNVFLKFSSETIFQLQPVIPGINTWDAGVFILSAGMAPARNQAAALSSLLLNDFEPGDTRKGRWIDHSDVAASGGSPAMSYYFPNKYKVIATPISEPLKEYLIVLRLAEQYLIRAEARAQLGDFAGAASDLNIIRKRAGLPDTNATDKATFLAATYHERQVELFTEWGHRWFDLKRTGNIDSIMKMVSVAKGAVWNSTAQLYPIPAAEILLNPNLKQNPGY